MRFPAASERPLPERRGEPTSGPTTGANCGEPTPFLDRDGQSFLEIHHVEWLSRRVRTYSRQRGLVSELPPNDARARPEQETLVSSSKERPLFHSEADFQGALAWAIQRRRPLAAVQSVGPYGERPQPNSAHHLETARETAALAAFPWVMPTPHRQGHGPPVPWDVLPLLEDEFLVAAA
jgi:hypothetical protein